MCIYSIYKTDYVQYIYCLYVPWPRQVLRAALKDFVEFVMISVFNRTHIYKFIAFASHGRKV